MAERINLGKLREVLAVPNLINIQVQSYEDFLQRDVVQKDRKLQGLHEVLKEVFPIESYDKQCVLDYVSYSIGISKTKLLDCFPDSFSHHCCRVRTYFDQRLRRFKKRANSNITI